MTYSPPINKCDCVEHNCDIQDDYTIDGNTCEECFMACVEMDNNV